MVFSVGQIMQEDRPTTLLQFEVQKKKRSTPSKHETGTIFTLRNFWSVADVEINERCFLFKKMKEFLWIIRGNHRIRPYNKASKPHPLSSVLTGLLYGVCISKQNKNLFYSYTTRYFFKRQMWDHFTSCVLVIKCFFIEVNKGDSRATLLQILS